MVNGFPHISSSSKPTTEFAQPRLSRVKLRSSPARGYKFGCVCSYMAGHYLSNLMTGHIGTNTPKFVPPHWGRPPFDPTQTQKNPRAQKNKIGTSPPPPKPKIPTPPKTKNFMDMAFPAERTLFFQASIKLAQPFPAPELRTKILRTRGFF